MLYLNKNGYSFNESNKKWLCINCWEPGHTFKYCLKPIISYGIILYKELLSQRQYLMIERRDSIGYTDLIRGKYTDEDTLTEFVESMTKNEIIKLSSYSFQQLWDDIFINKTSKIYKTEYQEALKKFNKLDIQNILSLSSSTNYKYSNAEIGFPKGRRHNNETKLNCAKREFLEETGVSEDYYTIFNTIPFKEEYISINGKRFIHIYFLARLKDETPEINLEINKDNFLQSGEIKEVKWVDFNTGYKNIRGYHYLKRGIFYIADTYLGRSKAL